MNNKERISITGEIFDETTEISIVEICEVCSVDRKIVEKMIDEGILQPTGNEREHRRFAYSSVRRTRTAIHLQRDLGVNLAGAALALELLERIDNLRAKLRRRN